LGSRNEPVVPSGRDGGFGAGGAIAARGRCHKPAKNRSSEAGHISRACAGGKRVLMAGALGPEVSVYGWAPPNRLSALPS